MLILLSPPPAEVNPKGMMEGKHHPKLRHCGDGEEVGCCVSGDLAVTMKWWEDKIGRTMQNSAFALVAVPRARQCLWTPAET